MSDFLVLLVASGAVGFLVSLAHKWTLERRTYSLECDVADLQDKILVEIKRRAALTPKLSKDEAAIVAALEKKTPEPEKPWWMQFTPEMHSTNRGNH